MMNGEAPRYDANLPVTVQLPLAAWQQVLNALMNPLFVEIQKQINATLEQTPPIETPRPESRA